MDLAQSLLVLSPSPPQSWRLPLQQPPDATATDGAAVHRVELLLSLIRESLVASGRQPVRVATLGSDDGLEVGVALDRWPEIGPRLDVMILTGGPPPSPVSGLPAAERWLTALANRRGAIVRFLASETLDPEDGALARSVGSRHLIYCARLPETPSAIPQLLPVLHDLVLPGGALALPNPPANTAEAGAILAWTRALPGPTVELRHSLLGPCSFLVVRR